MGCALCCSPDFSTSFLKILYQCAVLGHFDGRVLSLISKLDLVNHPAIFFMARDIGDLGVGRFALDGLLGSQRQ